VFIDQVYVPMPVEAVIIIIIIIIIVSKVARRG
jgi:hypothetical protein